GRTAARCVSRAICSKTRTSAHEGEGTMARRTVDQLREQVRGEVIDPGDEAYEEARKVYNAMIDRRPAVVVRPVNAGDVIAAVNFARESGLDLAIRGGSHGVPGFGTCDGGVAVDLSRMKGVRVDPAKGTARAEGGATGGRPEERRG